MDNYIRDTTIDGYIKQAKGLQNNVSLVTVDKGIMLGMSDRGEGDTGHYIFIGDNSSQQGNIWAITKNELLMLQELLNKKFPPSKKYFGLGE